MTLFCGSPACLKALKFVKSEVRYAPECMVILHQYILGLRVRPARKESSLGGLLK